MKENDDPTIGHVSDTALCVAVYRAEESERPDALFRDPLALIGYAHSGYSWWLFAALILVPDVSMLRYLINPSIGAASYNLVHTLTLPILLVFGAALFANMRI